MTKKAEEMDNSLPSYVCCVVTEGVWTMFGAATLILFLFTVASMKQLKRHLAKSKFARRKLESMGRLAHKQGRKVEGVIRQGDVSVGEFPDYCALRRNKVVNRHEFFKAVRRGRGTALESSPDRFRRLGLDFQKIDGTDRLGKDWIVSQGPTEDAIPDFWRMVWEEKSTLIVMLTSTFECVKLMCAQYWPLSEDVAETFDHFVVTLISVESFAHFKISTLEVGCQETRERRVIKHLHYLRWPVYQLPDSSSLLRFVNHLHAELEHQEKEAGTPSTPVVHCHDGRGRSGTFLAIEANLFKVKRDNKVNIFQTVQWLRNQRKGLVASPEQYKFIYHVLEDHVACGDTQVTAEKLSARVSTLAECSGGRNVSGFEKEYKKVCSLRPCFKIGDCAAGHRPENRKKNRNPSVVPPDGRRPYLTSLQNSEGGDYINAVFVDGYKTANEMICTEWPMASTLASFWSLIYDHEATTIVVLSTRKDQETFWPTRLSTPARYGSLFSVETRKLHSVDGGYEAWDMNLAKVPLFCTSGSDICSLLDVSGSHPKNVTLFRLCQRGGGRGKSLPTRSDFLQLMNYVSDWSKNNDTGEKGRHRTVIVSQDGVANIGIYCAARYCFDQVETRGTVDVFQAVRNIKKVRPQLVSNSIDYKYCYDLVLDFVRKRERTGSGSTETHLSPPDNLSKQREEGCLAPPP